MSGSNCPSKLGEHLEPKMTTMVNLTPHDVVVQSEDGKTTTISKSGKVARVAVIRTLIGDLSGFPVWKTTYGKVEDLPEPEEGKVYIVALLVLQALLGRTDLVAPDTSPESAVRKDGIIVAVRGFTVL